MQIANSNHFKNLMEFMNYYSSYSNLSGYIYIYTTQLNNHVLTLVFKMLSNVN